MPFLSGNGYLLVAGMVSSLLAQFACNADWVLAHVPLWVSAHATQISSNCHFVALVLAARWSWLPCWILCHRCYLHCSFGTAQVSNGSSPKHDVLSVSTAQEQWGLKATWPLVKSLSSWSMQTPSPKSATLFSWWVGRGYRALEASSSLGYNTL